MARQSGEERDANLAASVVALCQVLIEQIAEPGMASGRVLDKLIACQEIAFQCVTERQRQEFAESLGAIETFVAPLPEQQLTSESEGTTNGNDHAG